MVRRSWSKAASSQNSPGTNRTPSARLRPHVLAERGAGVLLDGVVDDLHEVLVGPVAAGEADEREARREQAAVGQVVDRRHQLLARQVARHPEDDHAARPGDPREPAVPGVAQRVGGTHGQAVRSRPRRAGRRPAPARGRYAASRAARPTTRRTCRRPRPRAPATTSCMSMPTAASARRSCAGGAVAGRHRVAGDLPWSATASRVFSGIVLTVSGATSSVDVQGVGVGRVLDPGRRPQRALDPAPRAASARQRSEAMTCSYAS